MSIAVSQINQSQFAAAVLLYGSGNFSGTNNKVSITQNSAVNIGADLTASFWMLLHVMKSMYTSNFKIVK